MTPQKDGYCWCDMCGFNAKLPAKFRAEVEDSYPCPWCKEAGGVLSLICVGDELEKHVIPDDPMMTWPQTDPRAVWFDKHLDHTRTSYPTRSGFADWYAVHGIPIGIGRENARVIYDAAVKGCEPVFVADTLAYNQTMERIKLTFSMLYDKWLSAGHRRDMNEAMELMARELCSPICPDCKCELVKPGNTCSRCDRPPEHSETGGDSKPARDANN